MVSPSKSDNDVDRFVCDEIETVPHLEALLLIWNSRPQPWSIENLSRRLYISEDAVRVLLGDLSRRELVVQVEPDIYGYHSKSTGQDRLLAAVDATYRREVIRLSTIIHSKPSASIREFARAFRITKDRK